MKQEGREDGSGGTHTTPLFFFAEEKRSPVLRGCSAKLKPSLDYGVVPAAVMGAGQLLFPAKLR